MTDQSNFESLSDSDGEARRFKSVDEIDGRSFHVKQQSRTVRSSKSTRNY